MRDWSLAQGLDDSVCLRKIIPSLCHVSFGCSVSFVSSDLLLTNLFSDATFSIIHTADWNQKNLCATPPWCVMSGPLANPTPVTAISLLSQQLFDNSAAEVVVARITSRHIVVVEERKFRSRHRHRKTTKIVNRHLDLIRCEFFFNFMTLLRDTPELRRCSAPSVPFPQNRCRVPCRHQRRRK